MSRIPAELRSWFFGAADPAPAQSARADDGAIVVLRATERTPANERDPGREAVESDFTIDYVLARVLRDAGVEQWSGSIHDLNDRFGFSNFVLDPGGGGMLIRKQLALSRQIVGGAEVTRIPIVTRDSTDVVQGQFILTMYQRAAAGIDQTWTGLQGDDVLKDYTHAAFKQALDGGLPAFPKPLEEWTKEEFRGLGPEQVWTLKNLDAGRAQLLKIVQLTNPDGAPMFTTRNARQFKSSGRDDIAMAIIYAYLAFVVWLRMGGAAQEGGGLGDEDHGMGW